MKMLISPYDASLNASSRLPAAARLLARALQHVHHTRAVGLDGFEELSEVLTQWANGRPPARQRLAPVLQRSMLELQRVVPTSSPLERQRTVAFPQLLLGALEALQATLMQHGPAVIRSCDAPVRPRIRRRQAPRARPAPWWFRLGVKLLPCTPWLDATSPGRSLCLAGLTLWRQHRAAR